MNDVEEADGGGGGNDDDDDDDDNKTTTEEEHHHHRTATGSTFARTIAGVFIGTANEPKKTVARSAQK